MDLLCEDRLLIDGALVTAADGRVYDNIDPTTEQVLGTAADAGPADVERAIAAARRAFDETDWATNHALRARCIRQLQKAFEDELEPLRASYVAEVGCPVQMTAGPALDLPVKALGYYADFLDRYAWSEDLGIADSGLGMGPSRRWIEREPIGVVGAISAWNFPHELNLKKVGWALAAGCTVVLKGAPQTPWCSLLLGRLLHEKTDLPPGVVNVITSSDNAIGERITRDPRVDMISFTGSTAVGKRILEATAPFVKRVCLELGGKSAIILLDDLPSIPDIAAAAGATVCSHAGQGCAIGSRLLVPRRHLDEAAEKLAASMARVKVGDPRNPETLQGPQCSALQRDRVLGLIQESIADGAQLLCGGGRPAHLERGYFVEPTAFLAKPDSIVAQREFFGPVQCLIGYDDDAEAIAIANRSDYGLSGAVVGLDLARAKSIARRVRTGTMSINGGMWYGPDVPFGGYKQSGLGRENGRIGFEEFLEVKALAVPASAT